jgi:hypothetical protein
MTKLKYMAYADEARIEKGDTLGDRLSDGLTAELVFNAANGWTVDTDELGVSQEEVDALLEADPDRFKDVSDLKRVPSNAHQKTFLGHGASKVQVDQSEPGPDGVPDAPNAGLGGGDGGVAGGAEAVGGSTSGPAGGAVGGSTRGRSRG